MRIGIESAAVVAGGGWSGVFFRRNGRRSQDWFWDRFVARKRKIEKRIGIHAGTVPGHL